MIKGYSKIYLQKVESLNKQGLVYSINTDGKTIGKLQESKKSSKKAGNQMIKLASLLLLAIPQRIIVENLEIDLLDEEGKIVGYIKKEIGFYKDLTLYTKNGEHIATVKSISKGKSPSIKVIDANGNELLTAIGSYDAIDFTVRDSSTNKLVTSIKKRSLFYETIKENLFNNDVYHIGDSDHKEDIVFELIGIVVAIDIHFHMGQ
ncbi:hypothetical protein F7984_14655 [Pradoshia sp. D12]|uniref:hypothetical protein n=1 Tax=Pradoshia sp. D12 TaxID=2651284 RepID=UPI00124C8846|nr:hypothetical protein [Pradoshia sp. D12]QFK72393.1 hypothetical protein F7984_14655 [Pradoshia sp. D12]